MGSDRLTCLWAPQREPEEAEEEDSLFMSSRECDCCGEGLRYTDEVFVIEVVEAAKEREEIFLDVLRDEAGEYLYRPYLMHLECWEATTEAIDEAIAEDEEILEAEDAILTCSRCESTIGNFEAFVGATFGELHMSPRSPSGKATAVVTRMSKVTPICLVCISHVVEDHLEDWEELLEILPEVERPEGEQEQ